ncbi:FecR domain-containing protein [uncultured Bacteroides sp.]|uniref:FecR family protein n=1 Tax=uncultured Bacteroides sp. TaxID=162156 RepID=UPI002AABA5A5|nr:FecR domain-containing protein [uncultured Bacteroides sp.]
MESSNIRNIICTFFEKNASKNTQLLFRKWFRLDEYPAEKEEYMEELWQNSPSVISAQTLEDFSKIKACLSDQIPAKPVYSLFQRIITYAAVIALIVASSVYLTYQFAVPAQLEYAQLSVSYGESKKITLSDGSVVAVNAGSTLIYPKSFSADTRTVFLTGEANFSVAKNPHKPFIVKTKYLDVRALGTKFNVQSYPNADYTKTRLVEGSVKVDIETGKIRSYILKPNNQLTYSHKSNNVSIADVDAAKLAAWEDGYLIFQGVTFNEIVNTLERKYNVVINCDGKKLSKQSFYVKFNPDESLEEVMNVLCMLINKSSYKIEGSTVYFYTK